MRLSFAKALASEIEDGEKVRVECSDCILHVSGRVSISGSGSLIVLSAPFCEGTDLDLDLSTCKVVLTGGKFRLNGRCVYGLLAILPTADVESADLAFGSSYLISGSRTFNNQRRLRITNGEVEQSVSNGG